jgi:hypothetical protein
MEAPMSRRPYLTARALRGIESVVDAVQKHLDVSRLKPGERDRFDDGLHYLQEFVEWKKTHEA